VAIFGVDWEQLTPSHVEAFLATAGREPLTWEAKGTEIRSDQVTKHVAGFANAEEGGYLLLGFEVADGEWRATGCEFPGDDPPVWISNVVRTTLRPRPRVDVSDWSVAENKRATVVRVEPVAEPPCITTGGQLYERVSGETILVKDPADVRALYERGRAAAERAEAAASRAIDAVNLGETGRSPGGPALYLGLALAPVGTPPDIAASVFAPGIDAELIEAVNKMPTEPIVFEGVHGTRVANRRVAQDAITVFTTPEFANAWNLRIGWDGSSAGLLRAFDPGGGQLQLVADVFFEDAVRPLSALVEKSARRVGGHGRAHVVLRILAFDVALIRNQTSIHERNKRNVPELGEMLPIRRWADGSPWFNDELLESMKRELLRACGFPEWEPVGVK
jgi:hypothetical protein